MRLLFVLVCGLLAGCMTTLPSSGPRTYDLAITGDEGTAFRANVILMDGFATRRSTSRSYVVEETLPFDSTLTYTTEQIMVTIQVMSKDGRVLGTMRDGDRVVAESEAVGLHGTAVLQDFSR